MKRNRIQVLIVDDEAAQGKALEEAFKRQGYSATRCSTSVSALTLAQRQEFHCLIVDCLLPKMNGVDLAEEIQHLAVRKPKVILYSGIYKDRNFVKEASERIQPLAFMTKPFDLEEMIGNVDAAFADELNQDDDPPLLSLYTEQPMSDRELVKLIESEPTIHAFHVPMLLKALQKTRLSGELTLISAVGDVNSIMFYDGRVFSVRTPDRDTYFGGLAVGYGFVSPDDVLEALRNPATKLLGQKLIESMSLSPHAITVIMEEQLALRLSQCVQNSVVSLEWTPHKFSKPDYALNLTRFDGLMDDWIKSKIDLDWIRTAMTAWGNYEIQGQFHAELTGPMTLNELLSNEDFRDTEDLPHLFRQLLYREAWFGLKTDDKEDFTFLEARLNQMLKDFKEQNHFQILGVGEKAHTQEMNRAFADLKAVFDPKILPASCPAPVMVKCTKVFQQIENAYKTLSEDTARAKYLILLQNKRSQSLLENEPVFRAAILELQCGHAKEAAKKFQSLIDRKLEFRDLRAYRIWAGLKTERNYSGMTLDQVPPEERHSPAFMMAKGVFHRNKGQIAKALQSFRTAHILDPRMSIAKHELKDLVQQLEKNRSGNRDILREVTSVVENLFGKSRKGA
jgi:CheY-like chemotaxis protein